ncbi:hypothetical protein [uncultured Metabacillus sp.]|uniref:hypothetical protein n=1 Tax=uncultured Metabacillus sp. TaxID=2860135 RepID=UPI00262B448C|nr:hypothetical protein [uncultured Metabacillus sp.]
MKFVVIYEIPPMRGYFQTVINAVNKIEAKEKFQLIDEGNEYQIKEIKELANLNK